MPPSDAACECASPAHRRRTIGLSTSSCTSWSALRSSAAVGDRPQLVELGREFGVFVVAQEHVLIVVGEVLPHLLQIAAPIILERPLRDRVRVLAFGASQILAHEA